MASARFMPDGPGIVYSAMWEGRPHELFWVFGGATESRSLGIQDATLLGISVDGAWCHAAFVQQRKLRFSLLADFEPKGAVAQSYGAWSIRPSTTTWSVTC